MGKIKRYHAQTTAQYGNTGIGGGQAQKMEFKSECFVTFEES
jgi:hypothetical protein